MAYKLTWKNKAREDYAFWEKRNNNVVERIDKLVAAIQIEPMHGIGKPEPLKHNMHGFWSRRITEEHRILYKITGDIIEIYRCRDHYE